MGTVTTTLSAASCAITNVIIHYFMSGNNYSLNATMNGVLSGLVSITAGCAVVEPGMAVIIGMVGAFVYTGWSNLMIFLRIDDVVDAVAVHGACGMWGVIAAALFAKGTLSAEYGPICQYGYDTCEGLFYGGNGKLLGMAFLEIVMIWIWVGGFMGAAFFLFDLAKMLRVSVHDETYLLAMCIDQNVAPLSMLMKFDKIAGPSGIIDNDSAYEQLVELVGYNYDDSTVQVDVESY